MSLENLTQTIQTLMPQAREDLTRMVSFKSVHDPAQFPPEECQRMVDWTIGAFDELGVTTEQHVTPDGSTLIYGRWNKRPGAPTVLLYFHHDVQPPLVDSAWLTPPWELTERHGRWHGRGTADCKGNIAVHLTALRALRKAADDGGYPVNLIIAGEGSEEQGTGGLEQFVAAHPDMFNADVMLIADAGNFAVGAPSVTTSLRGLANVVVTVETLHSAMHSGMFGGAAPDALAALIHMLSTLRDKDGNTTIDGLDTQQVWPGGQYPADRFRVDATVVDGVDLLGSGTIADMLWSRPAVTVLGIDCPPVVGSSAAIQGTARARINLRVPPGMDAIAAQSALIDHLTAAAPWGAKVTCVRESDGEPYSAVTSGTGYDTMAAAMREVYGADVIQQGQGGSIPLCNVFHDTVPNAQILLIGVEEPACLIHAPNESVAPSEIENMARVESLFLENLAKAWAARA